MNKTLKYALFGIGGLASLLVIGAIVLTLTFDPNDYKPLIVKLVQEKKQRTLDIEGDIKLAFWPKLGADLGRVRLSEHNSDKEFAAIESARVFVAVMPLLSKQLVVDTVRVSGVRANIVRYKDGSTNFDDLLSEEEETQEEVKFDVDGIVVSDSAVSLTDEMEGRSIAISELSLETGHVAMNQPIDLSTEFKVKADNPAVDARLSFTGTLLADTEQKRFGAKGMALALEGDVATLKGVDLDLSGDVEAQPELQTFMVDSLQLKLKADIDGQATEVEVSAPSLVAKQDEVSGKQARVNLKQSRGNDFLKADLVLADLKGSPKAFQSSGISGEIEGRQGARNIAGKFNSPFSGNLEQLIFDLPKLAGDIRIKDPALPKGEMAASFNVNAHAEIKQELARVSLAAVIDGSKLDGNVAVAGFAKPSVNFDLTADQLDINKILGEQKKSSEPAKAAAPDKPADLSALKDVIAQGSLKVGSIRYDQYRISNLALKLKADGKTLSVSPLSAKLDESQLKGSVGIRNFERPVYLFDLDIDKLDADRYVTQGDAKPAETKPKSDGGDQPIDLSALKALNAEGSLRIGWLKLANVTTTNVRLTLKADGGMVDVAPFSANLYQGSMAGSLNVDARATPAIAFKQDMKGIEIGPLLQDAINNDMLDGKGSVNLDIRAQGGTVDTLKKGLNGKAALNLADGAIKGFDLAGTLRSAKDKINVLQGKSTAVASNEKQKTDFSEMKASFDIKNGVAHNEDLDIKSPLFRIGGNGDIDIGNETLNYLAKPTVVATLKGQGGDELGALNGITVPVKVSGTFSEPRFGPDFAAMGTAMAKQKLLDKVGGDKAAPLQQLMEGDKAGAIESLIGGKKATDPKTTDPAPAEGAPATTQEPPATTEPAPETKEDKVKKGLKLLGF